MLSADASKDEDLLEMYERLRHVYVEVARLPPRSARQWLLSTARGLLGKSWERSLSSRGREPPDWAVAGASVGFAIAYLADLLDSLDGRRPAVAWVGCDPHVRMLRDQIPGFARSPYSLFVLGERGTGKSHFARSVHAERGGNMEGFYQVSCAALPDGLVESQLFGHVKGAFTGAVSNRAGILADACASGGTLLLDELGDFSAGVQAQLLQVLEEGTYYPVGADRPVELGGRADAGVKICAASQPNALGKIRMDLRDRISTLLACLPPLRERRLDVLLLADMELEALSRREGRTRRLCPEGRAELLRFDWPGNVRQLQNILRRAASRSASAVLDPFILVESINEDRRLSSVLHATHHADSASGISTGSGTVATPDTMDTVSPSGPEWETRAFPKLKDVEERHIRAALTRTGGNIAAAARLLGLPRTTLQSRLRSDAPREDLA